MHMDEFIFNYCVSSMLSDETTDTSTESAMNVFSIDENKIRDANGIIFAEAITCYKCTFCGKMFAAMEVVLTHYQSNHRCSVIPLLKGKLNGPKKRKTCFRTCHLKGLVKPSAPKIRPVVSKSKCKNKNEPYGPIKPRPNVLAENTATNESPELSKDNISTISNDVNNFHKKKDNKKFECHYPGCAKSFSYKIGLETHQKSHKKLKSYKCDWNDCKFKCSDLAGLHFHKNTHSGDNPFKCVWPGCSMSFPDSAAKDEHLQTEHIKDKLLECDYVGCDQKFISAKERYKHSLTHVTKKVNQNSDPNTEPKKPGRGRPPKKKKPIIESSSSEDEDEEDSSEDEDNDENVEEEDIQSESITKTKADVPKSEPNEQPLDLSKTAIDLLANNTAIDLTLNSLKEQVNENKTPAKRGRKRKKSKDNTVEKSIKQYRCDYPGCRKTFPEADSLYEHEKEAHKTVSTEGRSRYERRCKGNLYYKL